MKDIDMNKVNELADKIIKMKELGLNTTALEQMLQQMMAAVMQQPEPKKEPEKEPYTVEEKDGLTFITVPKNPKSLASAFKNGDISLVTKKEQFYENGLYYEACMVPDETTKNRVKYLLEQKAKELGGTALCKLFNQNYVAKKKEIKKKEKKKKKGWRSYIRKGKQQRQRKKEERVTRPSSRTCPSGAPAINTSERNGLPITTKACISWKTVERQSKEPKLAAAR